MANEKEQHTVFPQRMANKKRTTLPSQFSLWEKAYFSKILEKKCLLKRGSTNEGFYLVEKVGQGVFVYYRGVIHYWGVY